MNALEIALLCSVAAHFIGLCILLFLLEKERRVLRLALLRTIGIAPTPKAPKGRNEKRSEEWRTAAGATNGKDGKDRKDKKK